MKLHENWKLLDFAPGQGLSLGAHALDYDDGDWLRSYRTIFQFSEDEAGDAIRYLLRFDCLDTFATAYLNGVEVGRHATMLTRPTVSDLPDLCWRAEADLAKLMIPEASLQPVLTPELWEYKVGWSTNTVQLSQDEYLVGWHGILREDFSYRNGLAIVHTEGKLQAISDYLLAPKGLSECYGDRSLAIFGNGLVVYKDYLIWIGGGSDYGIGIFITKIEEALEKLRPLR